MGVAIVTILLLLLLSILWGPTLVAMKNTNKQIVSRFGTVLLASELAIAVSAVLFADFIGLTNPGGIIVASVLVVSGSGYVFVSQWSR